MFQLEVHLLAWQGAVVEQLDPVLGPAEQPAHLTRQLAVAESSGALEAALTPFAWPHLLIIDAFGYLPLARQAGHLLFQLVRRR